MSTPALLKTARCLANVETILLAAGSSLQCVLRCGVFLLDMAEFPEMNAVCARVFGEHRPARTTIQAAALQVEELRGQEQALYTRLADAASAEARVLRRLDPRLVSGDRT